MIRLPRLLGLCASVIVLFALALSVVGPLSAESLPASVAETCLDWNIQGEWQYRASGGGYGTFNFLQDASGQVNGTWYNAAGGWSGTLAGQITGASIVWGIPSSGENFQGTVAATGQKMAGTYSYGQTNGTWEATGAAHCLRWSEPPPIGAAHATVRWGEYTYHVNLPAGGSAAIAPDLLSPAAPQQAGQPPTITFLGDVTLDIEAVIYTANPPGSLQVVERVDGGPRRALGTLNRVGSTADGGTLYRGSVTVRPLGPIGVGNKENHDVLIVDPDDNEWRLIRIVMLLIDPSGYIYDTSNSSRVEGAMVSLYRNEGGQWVLWNAAQYLQTNPQVSDAEGRYGWEVPEGDYQVRVSKRCFAPTQSASLHIPPPRTDVNLGLSPVTCSELTITGIWTADGAGKPKSEFRQGEHVVTHVQVSSTATQDITVAGSWLVTGPEGHRVSALSGTGTYVVAPFGAELTFAGDLSVTAPLGSYGFGLELVDQGQILFGGTQFSVHEQAGRICLPLVLRTQPQVLPGIAGRVTIGQAPGANVDLSLLLWNGEATSTVATATTGSDGRYQFLSVASLPSGQVYYVQFGPNSTDPNLLFVWYGPNIESYTAGTAQPGGDFDIANVRLLSPGGGATVTLPATFVWQTRGVPGDSYAWRFFDLTGDGRWITNPLGAADRFTLGSLPSGVAWNHDYGWAVRVYAAEDSYGESYYYRRVVFSQGAAAAAPSAPEGDLVLQGQADKHLPRR